MSADQSRQQVLLCAQDRRLPIRAVRMTESNPALSVGLASMNHLVAIATMSQLATMSNTTHTKPLLLMVPTFRRYRYRVR